MSRPEMPEVPEQQSGEPYALPELTTAEVRELEERTAEQVATVRDEQALKIANLGNDKLPHFLVTEDGVEKCGTDGDPWPCATWMDQINPAQVAESEGLPGGQVAYTPAELTAARALGMDPADLRAQLDKR